MSKIILFIANNNRDVTYKLKEDISAKIERLKEFPKLGRVVPEQKMRKKDYRMLTHDNYLIYYRMIEDSIYIYRILHGLRDYPHLFNQERRDL